MPGMPLAYGMKRNRQEIYCINAENVMEGPFGQEQQLKYELISSDPKIRDIAARTGLSERSVLKIMAIAQARKSYVFDAHELADCLEVTALQRQKDHGTRSWMQAWEKSMQRKRRLQEDGQRL